MFRFSPLILAAGLGFVLSAPSRGATVSAIDFDTGYADNFVFSTDGVFLKESGGATSSIVTLSTAGSNTMSVEAVGDGETGRGFKYDTGNTYDVKSPRETVSSLGTHFLRTTTGLSGALTSVSPIFTFGFVGGAARVSGELWDIDGTNSSSTEAWRVTAKLAGGGTVDILSPVGTSNRDTTSLDGQAWRFSFDRTANDILLIDFYFTGSKTNGIGAAFDNLSVTQLAPVPLPAGLALLLGGVAGLGALRRRARGAAL